MTEGMEDFSAGPAPPPGSTSPTSSTVDTGHVPKEKPEEIEAAGESGEEGAEGTAEGGGGDDDGEHLGALGIVALPGTCCVCIEIEQINNCLHSEKICILPILACLLSLALCTAGLKWVFVDKIFEYEPPTHLDPKPIGQDPIIISVDPTLGLTVSIPHSSPATVSLTTAITPGHPNVLVEEKSTQGPYVLQSPRVTQSDPSVTLKYNAERPNVSKQAPHPQTTQELNNIIIPTVSATSTTTTAKTSSHVTRCSDSQRNYCVNGGECFTLEIMPGSTKFLCRCLAGFTGHRCEQAVLKKVSDPKPEELYQKRILTITGICIALLVVGIMCVVAYCKTKKQRKKLHDRLRQSKRNKRNNNTNTGIGPNLANAARQHPISNLPLQDFQPINQCNETTMQHATEKETEMNFSTSKYALSAHEPTTFTQISSQRSVSAMTTPTQLSPVSQTSLTTPGSPPSEMSAPLSSLAISVPSVALSPSGEEERPLLLLKTHQQHKSSGRDEQKRTSAYYNHGHVEHSLPPSPLFSMENGNYQIIDDHNSTAASHMLSASPEKLLNKNNNINNCSINSNGHLLHNVESSGVSMLKNESQEPQGEHTPFITTDSTTAHLRRAVYSSRTNPASSNDDLQVKPSNSTTKQDPVTV
ncbi:pro-neuregulin-1, membrane-bound isoform isoform X3 [Sparus aurata]|uniref:pro-neuregulin-1, membrane-bound isoform isoform X3 n=1 Tax=Sparus aurata TaxID=8175 RepID=UPI0011C0EDA6|nr:pro-neuregulin-1, membrane-bound isoform-like isoform X3 [Sparus aurata]